METWEKVERSCAVHHWGALHCLDMQDKPAWAMGLLQGEWPLVTCMGCLKGHPGYMESLHWPENHRAIHRRLKELGEE